jgi:hypothetical protein
VQPSASNPSAASFQSSDRVFSVARFRVVKPPTKESSLRFALSGSFGQPCLLQVAD